MDTIGATSNERSALKIVIGNAHGEKNYFLGTDYYQILGSVNSYSSGHYGGNITYSGSDLVPNDLPTGEAGGISRAGLEASISNALYWPTRDQNPSRTAINQNSNASSQIPADNASGNSVTNQQSVTDVERALPQVPNESANSSSPGSNEQHPIESGTGSENQIPTVSVTGHREKGLGNVNTDRIPTVNVTGHREEGRVGGAMFNGTFMEGGVQTGDGFTVQVAGKKMAWYEKAWSYVKDGFSEVFNNDLKNGFRQGVSDASQSRGYPDVTDGTANKNSKSYIIGVGLGQAFVFQAASGGKVPVLRAGKGQGVDGTTGCFVAGTLVWTNDGLKPIESIRVGDFVLSQPETTGERAYRRVNDTFALGEKRIYTITLVDESGRFDALNATPNHPFFVPNVGWKGAEYLEVGDPVEFHDGSIGIVANVLDTGASQDVFNFEVDGFHTYYVGTLGVWVHNVNCGKAAAEGANTTGTGPTAVDRVIQGIDPRQLNRSHSIGGKRSTARVEEIANSMREKGFNGPSIDVVEANGKYYIVDGHHRAAAALQTGTKVDIKIINDIKSHSSNWETIAEVLRDAEMVGPNRLIPKGKY